MGAGWGRGNVRVVGVGKAERKLMSAPRSMKLEVLRRRMSASLLAEYSMATLQKVG